MPGVALVHRQAQAPVGVLVEQRRTGHRVAEGPQPGDRDRAVPERDGERRAGVERPERRREVRCQRGQLHVPERVDVDHARLEDALADARRGQRGSDERRRVELRPERPELHPERQVGRRRREDVAPVEAGRDDRQTVPRIAQLDGVRGPAQALERPGEQAVVGAGEDVAPAGSDRDRPPRGAHARIDDRDVDAGRQVRQCAPQQQRAVTDRVLPDLVADVDDLDVGRDAQDRPADDRRRRVACAEVGEQREERAGHGS